MGHSTWGTGYGLGKKALGHFFLRCILFAYYKCFWEEVESKTELTDICLTSLR